MSELCPIETTAPATTSEAIVTTALTTPSSTAVDKDKTAVLILSTRYPSNVPKITDINGRVSAVNFIFGNTTEVYRSCSLVFRGRAYVYGGYNEKRQISLVENCQLSRVSSLLQGGWKQVSLIQVAKAKLVSLKLWNDSSFFSKTFFGNKLRFLIFL